MSAAITALIKKWKRNHQDCHLTEVFNHWLPLIDNHAKKYFYLPEFELDELKDRMRFALIRAIQTYKPRKNCQFNTLAWTCIHNITNLYFKERTRTLQHDSLEHLWADTEYDAPKFDYPDSINYEKQAMLRMALDTMISTLNPVQCLVLEMVINGTSVLDIVTFCANWFERAEDNLRNHFKINIDDYKQLSTFCHKNGVMLFMDSIQRRMNDLMERPVIKKHPRYPELISKRSN